MTGSSAQPKPRVIRRVFIAMSGLVILFQCAGCGGVGDPTPITNETPTATAETGGVVATTDTEREPPPMEVGEVIWSRAVDENSKAPTRIVESFPADARRIFAVLPVANVPPGQTFVADWTYNDTPLDRLRTSFSVPLAEPIAWIEFHLIRSDELWPDGTYAITVSVAGEVVQTGQVQIEN